MKCGSFNYLKIYFLIDINLSLAIFYPFFVLYYSMYCDMLCQGNNVGAVKIITE